MKFGLMMSSLLLSMAVITGCTDVTSTKIEDNAQGKNAVNTKKTVIENTNEKTGIKTKEVQLDYLKLKVNSKWDVNKGLDSAAFSLKGKSIGIIEGLAYADSLEALLPNQSIIEDKQKLKNLPFEAYQVTARLDAVQAKSKKETHIYMFVEPKKEVYDMHFDANAVDENTILEIVNSAVIFNTK